MSKKGFTIVELLIVVVVIAILAAITVVAYTGIQGQARDSQRLSDMRQIVQAIEVYGAKNGRPPAAMSEQGSSAWEVSTNGTTATNFLSPLVTSGTISKVPLDPKNTGSSLSPSRSEDRWYYFYYRYAAGSNGCDLASGEYYVVGVTRFDSVAEGTTHPDSPGFKCTGRDWTITGAWVTGGYIK